MRGRVIRRSAPVVDVIVLTLALVLERIAVPEGLAITLASLVFPVLTVVLLDAAGLYRVPLRPRVLDLLRTIVATTAIAAMTTLALAMLMGTGVSTAHAVRLWVFAACYLSAVRSGMLFARRERVPTLIVGAGDIGNLVAKRLLAHPEVGLVPVGFVDDEPKPGGVRPVLGGSSDLIELIETHRIRQVVIAFSKSAHEGTLDLIDNCSARGVRVAVVPRLFERVPNKLTFDYIGSLPLVSLFPTDPESAAIRLKYAFDRVIAAAALIVLSPAMAAIAVGVAASVGRPILFRQRRVGRNGRVFVMLKFRTMSGAPADSVVPEDLSVELGPGGVEGVDRRTRVGKFLRATSLDELPQLFNVARGDMSLVGPRPERPELAEEYRKRVARYADRERMKSGMTGWAQVHGLRGKTSLADRVEWDNWYVENCSPWLDFKILVDTTRAVAGALTAE